MPARTADVIALHGGDAIALLEAAHITAGVDDGAGDLVPEDARHLHPGLQRPVARDDVVKAHAAGVDLDDDILRPRCRIRYRC
jgi:hypothetical protein